MPRSRRNALNLRKTLARTTTHTAADVEDAPGRQSDIRDEERPPQRERTSAKCEIVDAGRPVSSGDRGTHLRMMVGYVSARMPADYTDPDDFSRSPTLRHTSRSAA